MNGKTAEPDSALESRIQRADTDGNASGAPHTREVAGSNPAAPTLMKPCYGGAFHAPIGGWQVSGNSMEAHMAP